MKKVLITGGCGFVGANLVAHAAFQDRYDVTVVDNESLGRRENLEAFGGRFINRDIAVDPLDDLFDGIEAVVHLAAHTRVVESMERPEQNFRDNVLGTFRTLEACRKAGVQRFINASTGGAILGEAPVPVHEELVPHPLAPYGASKLAAEGYCSAYTGSYGMSCASLRFSNLFGPRSFHKESVVAHFLKRIISGEELVIYGDGSQIRDYLFVGDLVEGIVNALESDSVGVFQLGAGRPTTLNELIEVIKKVTVDRGTPTLRYAPKRRGEIQNTWCDISKARRAFGFDPQTTLEDGIRQTWEWFLAQEDKAGRDGAQHRGDLAHG